MNLHPYDIPHEMHYFYSGRNISTPAGINTFAYILPVACGVAVASPNKRKPCVSRIQQVVTVRYQRRPGSDGETRSNTPRQDSHLRMNFAFRLPVDHLPVQEQPRSIPASFLSFRCLSTDNTYCFFVPGERANFSGETTSPVSISFPAGTSFSCGIPGCSIRMILVRIYCT